MINPPKLPQATEERLHRILTDQIARHPQMEKDGFPAVHHSTRYDEAYHPAYRVIKLEYLSNL